MDMDVSARLRAVLEEELGELPRFAELSASEIEAMAGRLARAVEPLVLAQVEPERRTAA